MQRTLLLGVHNMLGIANVFKSLIFLGYQSSTRHYSLQTERCVLISGNTVPDFI